MPARLQVLSQGQERQDIAQRAQRLNGDLHDRTRLTRRSL